MVFDKSNLPALGIGLATGALIMGAAYYKVSKNASNMIQSNANLIAAFEAGVKHYETKAGPITKE